MKFYAKLAVVFFGLVYGGLGLMAHMCHAEESYALQLFNQVNEERASQGLMPLRWSNDLEEVAEVRSEEASVCWSHTRPDGRQWNTVNRKLQGGENLAYCLEGEEEEKIFVGWMNSPLHRDNILYSEFKTAAISTYTVDGETYASLEFGY